jgi:hypothetical protein
VLGTQAPPAPQDYCGVSITAVDVIVHVLYMQWVVKACAEAVLAASVCLRCCLRVLAPAGHVQLLQAVPARAKKMVNADAVAGCCICLTPAAEVFAASGVHAVRIRQCAAAVLCEFAAQLPQMC